MEVVEAPDVGVQVRPGPVRLGHHHHHRVRDRTAAEHQQLEHVVEDRRVGSALADDRHDLLEVVSEQLRGELRLSRPHPVDVPAQRVDLAVVRDHPIRVRELPARECVGREARVHQRQPRSQPRIAKVDEVPRQLRRGQHALVDHRPAREARQRQVPSRGPLDQPADHVQLALEYVLAGDLSGCLDQHLPDHGRRQPRRRADVLVVDRHVAPPDRALSLGLDRVLDQLLEHQPPLGVARQVADTDAVPAGRRKLDPGGRAPQERVGDLQEDPRAVAGVRVGALGTTMLEVLERVERLLDHRVTGLAPQLRDQRDAARVVLVRRVVEACGPRRSCSVVHLEGPGS